MNNSNTGSHIIATARGANDVRKVQARAVYAGADIRSIKMRGDARMDTYQVNLSLLQIGTILEQLYYVLTQSLPVSQRAVQLAKRYK